MVLFLQVLLPQVFPSLDRVPGTKSSGPRPCTAVHRSQLWEEVGNASERVGLEEEPAQRERERQVASWRNGGGGSAVWVGWEEAGAMMVVGWRQGGGTVARLVGPRLCCQALGGADLVWLWGGFCWWVVVVVGCFLVVRWVLLVGCGGGGWLLDVPAPCLVVRWVLLVDGGDGWLLNVPATS